MRLESLLGKRFIRNHEQTDWWNGIALYAEETEGLTPLDSIQIKIHILRDKISEETADSTQG